MAKNLTPRMAKNLAQTHPSRADPPHAAHRKRTPRTETSTPGNLTPSAPIPFNPQ